MSSYTNAGHFYPICGLLHSPDYRSRYADTLGNRGQCAKIDRISATIPV